MNIFDARFPCEHGRYEEHEWRRPTSPGAKQTHFLDDCPGGSPVTAADLEGAKVVWCAEHDSKGIIQGVIRSPVMCEWAWLHRLDAQEGCQMVERLLIPIPESQPVAG